MNPVIQITSQKQLLEVFGQPIGNEMFTPEMIAESMKIVQQVDRVLSVKEQAMETMFPGLHEGFKPKTLQVFGRAVPKGKSKLDQTDWFDWSDPPDGLTDDETGPACPS